MNHILYTLLHLSRAKNISKRDLELQLLTHHDYPSLKAITDTLDYFGIENIAAHVPKDAIDHLPNRFLAMVKNDTHEEIVLTHCRKEKITTTDTSGKKRKLHKDEFIKSWTGTIIAVEESESSIKKKRFHLKEFGLIALAVVLTILVNVQNEPSWQHISFTLLSYIGLYISYLITKESLGIKDMITSKVCNTLSQKAQGCSAVISSKKGEITNGFHLGDACMIYFSCISFTTSLFGVQESLLLILSFSTLPVIPYSIYAQAYLLKEWCTLCLIVSGILLIQLMLITTTFHKFSFSSTYLLKAIFIGFLFIIFWIQIKKLWKNRLELKKITQEFYTFKRNPKFFNFALSEKRIENNNPLNKKHRLLFGNPEADLRIIAVTNPFCGYCAAPFLEYTKILERYQNDISLEIVFNVFTNEEHPATQIVLRVIEVYQEDPLKAFESLKFWYSNKDTAVWFKHYSKPQNLLDLSIESLVAQSNWCKENNIYHTPETFINDHYYPKENYKENDLILFIDDLKEQSKVSILELAI